MKALTVGYLPASIDRLVVVDVETAGLYDNDRIVEVAAVTLSPDGSVLDEWDTLVNPGRDVGATPIHGITASMVSAAPLFEEIASSLAARIDGAVLVAHNLAFDSRMLRNEYRRLRAALNPGKGICTLSLSGQRLPDACARFGVDLGRHHGALSDARATAQLFFALQVRDVPLWPAHIEGICGSTCPRTLRREQVLGAVCEVSSIGRAMTAARLRGEAGPTLVYLDMLDWAFADLHIDDDEGCRLQVLAAELGLSPQHVAGAHRRYLDELIVAAIRDGRVTDGESRLLCRVARALGFEADVVQREVERWRPEERTVMLKRGMRVCFTGAATSTEGCELPRTALADIAEQVGLEVVETVTKKNCDLLVAADRNSQSGKALKARQFGIPIVEVRHFLCAECGSEVPVC